MRPGENIFSKIAEKMGEMNSHTIGIDMVSCSCLGFPNTLRSSNYRTWQASSLVKRQETPFSTAKSNCSEDMWHVNSKAAGLLTASPRAFAH